MLTKEGGKKLMQTSLSDFMKTTKKTAGAEDTGQTGGEVSISDVSAGQASKDARDKPGTDVTAERFGEDEDRTGK